MNEIENMTDAVAEEVTTDRSLKTISQSVIVSRSIFFSVVHLQLHWNLELTNLYITKPSVERTILFSPVIV